MYIVIRNHSRHSCDYALDIIYYNVLLIKLFVTCTELRGLVRTIILVPDADCFSAALALADRVELTLRALLIAPYEIHQKSIYM